MSKRGDANSNKFTRADQIDQFVSRVINSPDGNIKINIPELGDTPVILNKEGNRITIDDRRLDKFTFSFIYDGKNKLKLYDFNKIDTYKDYTLPNYIIMTGNPLGVINVNSGFPWEGFLYQNIINGNYD